MSGQRVLDTDSFLDDLNLGPTQGGLSRSHDSRSSDVYTFSREFSQSINPYNGTGTGTRSNRTPSSDGQQRNKPNSLKNKSPGNELANKRNFEQAPQSKSQSRETSRSNDNTNDYDSDVPEETPDYHKVTPGNKGVVQQKESVSRYEAFEDKKMIPGDFKADDEERTSVSGCILS